ncbi:MAG: NADH-quinone oxidoreductase subunit C [Rickettsiales bacterium]|jgi:NADH-quinone oxidoreductase subunit C|nr:NADH-quinone oxidoreductase subunit C [Rickettsiales bacterium]
MESVVKHIKNNAASLLLSDVEMNDNMIVLHAHPRDIKELLFFLRDESKCLFVMLMSIHAVDYYQEAQRFEVNYNLLSLKHNKRLVIKLRVDDKVDISSVDDIFSSATWYQREVFDMYGVKFIGSLDDRRILTDYNFKGHPLRKDFPLTGYEEVRYDSTKKEVVYEPVKLDQEFRNFDFDSSWSAAKYIAPAELEDKKGGS